MGHFFSRPPESVSFGAPPLRTPFTDITAPIGHHKSGPCMPMELRYLDCMEAYGNVRGHNKCAELYQDYVECAMNWKQLHRVEAMKNERDRQWVKGVLGKGPKTKLYVEDAPYSDTYVPNITAKEP